LSIKEGPIDLPTVLLFVKNDRGYTTFAKGALGKRNVLKGEGKGRRFWKGEGEARAHPQAGKKEKSPTFFIFHDPRESKRKREKGLSAGGKGEASFVLSW